MNNPDGDPRIPQVLDLITACGSLLQRAERILQTTRPRDLPYLDVLLLRLRQANYYIAMGWTRALSQVPEPPPLEPTAAPEVSTPETPKHPDYTPALPWHSRVLEE